MHFRITFLLFNDIHSYKTSYSIIIFINVKVWFFNHICCKGEGKGKVKCYSSPNILPVIKARRMRWAGHVARVGEERGMYRDLVGKLEGRRPLGRPRCRWGVILEWISRRWDVSIWTGFGWPRWRALASAVMNLRVPWNAGNFLTCCKSVSFSRRTLHHGVSKDVSVITQHT